MSSRQSTAYRLAAMAALGMLLCAGVARWLYAAGGPSRSTATADAQSISGQLDANHARTITYLHAGITQGKMQFHADTIVQSSQGNMHQFTCTGNPTLTESSRTISAQQLMVATTPRTAVFTGGVQLSTQPGTRSSTNLLNSEPMIIHSDLLTYHYGDRYAEFTGNIKMTITPHPHGAQGTAIKQSVNAAPSTMTCTLLSYDYNSGKATANGNVVVIQQLRTIMADQAYFYEDGNYVLLSGNIRMRNAGEDQFKSLDNAERIAVSLDDRHGWYTVDAKQGKKINLSVDVDEGK